MLYMINELLVLKSFQVPAELQIIMVISEMSFKCNDILDSWKLFHGGTPVH